jgi:hypothetical protein
VNWSICRAQTGGGGSAVAVDSKRLKLVEAGGVELQAGVENMQLADSAMLPIAHIAYFARSVSRFVTVCNTRRLVHGRRSLARSLATWVEVQPRAD